jgi:tripartite-type tricarboxylate transporter receptor subunit TctC
MKTKTQRLVVSLALALAMAPLAARAEYPEKPVTIIVGYAAGGGTDILARTVAPYVEKYLGNNAKLVIKNVPGAGGQIGFTQVATAAPDGYTIGTFNQPAAAAMTLDRKADYAMDSFTYLVKSLDERHTGGQQGQPDQIRQRSGRDGQKGAGLSDGGAGLAGGQ